MVSQGMRVLVFLAGLGALGAMIAAALIGGGMNVMEAVR